jgi:hypothetical protein
VKRQVQNLTQPDQLRREVDRVVANEETKIVGRIGARDSAADHIEVIELHDVMTQEITARDDAKADLGLGQRCEDAPAVGTSSRIEDDGERESRRTSILALDDEAVISGKQ